MDDHNESFLGIGWGFPPEFHPRSVGVRMVAEEEDVREALWILLSTKPGERVMHPSYGCGLHQMVFEGMNESTVTEIKDLVERAVLFFEPRVSLVSLEVEIAEANEGLLNIFLEYDIRTTNSRNNMVYPFYIGEGTHVAL